MAEKSKRKERAITTASPLPSIGRGHGWYISLRSTLNCSICSFGSCFHLSNSNSDLVIRLDSDVPPAHGSSEMCMVNG